MKCSICGDPLKDKGHSAEPINNGRCCEICNQLVTYRRINDAGIHVSFRELVAMEELAQQLRRKYEKNL
jgi:uncharacterized membrane protein affecting hemolysin expression